MSSAATPQSSHISNFMACVLLRGFAAGIASNLSAALNKPPPPVWEEHAISVASALTAVMRATLSICAEAQIRDEQDLNEVLEAVRAQFEVADECDDADEVVARSCLEHVYQLVERNARIALQEAISGFPVSMGNFLEWEEERAGSSYFPPAATRQSKLAQLRQPASCCHPEEQHDSADKSSALQVSAIAEAEPMPKNRNTTMPRTLVHQPDTQSPGLFQVVDSDGVVWAAGVRNEAAARVFAASPGLLLGYDWMLEEVHAYFHVRWNIRFNGPDFDEFLEDEGELEHEYPGAPDHAWWLQELRERSDDTRGPEGESPFAPDVKPQTALF